MSIEKLFFVLVIVYLVVALPLWFFADAFFERCTPVCEKNGYNITIKANWFNSYEILCHCMSGFDRQTAFIPLGVENNE